MQTVENTDIMGKKVADQLVETICRAGIRRIYAVTGDSLNEVNAHRSNCSVLAIASTCPSDQFGTGYFQETNPIRLFDDCSGYNQMAVTPAQFARMLPAALQHAVHKREVAVVGLPGDVAASPCAESPGTPGPLPSHGIYRPRDGELRQLA